MREQLKEKRATLMVVIVARMVVIVINRMEIIIIMPWMSGVSLRFLMSGCLFELEIEQYRNNFQFEKYNFNTFPPRISATWSPSGKTYALVGAFHNQFSSIDDLIDFYSTQQQLAWLPINKDLRLLPSQLTDSRCQLFPFATSFPESVCSGDSRSMVDFNSCSSNSSQRLKTKADQ